MHQRKKLRAKLIWVSHKLYLHICLVLCVFSVTLWLFAQQIGSCLRTHAKIRHLNAPYDTDY